TLMQGDLQLVVDREAGRLLKLAHNGNEVIQKGPTLQIWRAPTDNDANTWGDQVAAKRWREAGLDRLQEQVDGVSIVEDSGSTQIEVRGAAVAVVDADAAQAARW